VAEMALPRISVEYYQTNTEHKRRTGRF